jgi:hypothetical protein
VPERWAAADDPLETHLAAEFFLEIKLLLGELVFQPGNLFIGKGIFDCDGNLAAYEAEKVDLVRIIWPLCRSPDSQDSQSAAAAYKRNIANGLLFREKRIVRLFLWGKSSGFEVFAIVGLRVSNAVLPAPTELISIPSLTIPGPSGRSSA